MLNGDGSEADYDTDGLPADRRVLASAKKPRCVGRPPQASMASVAGFLAAT